MLLGVAVYFLIAILLAVGIVYLLVKHRGYPRYKAEIVEITEKTLDN